MTAIEWTDETWNPTVGCSRVSPGCDHCYAVRVAARELQPAHAGLTVKLDKVVIGEGEPVVTPGGGRLDWTGEVRCLPERLDTPLHWRKPRRVFVDSMSDLFHPDVRLDFIDEVFAVMVAAGRHTFQVLTKRPQRMATVVGDPEMAQRVQRIVHEKHETHMFAGWPYPSIWLGTSVENQRYADLRIPHLLATPAAVRFLSIEPLLGPVDLRAWLPEYVHRLKRRQHRNDAGGPGIDWVIVGGESGPGARPVHPEWVRDLRDQCTYAGVPFFFKQWGDWRPGVRGEKRQTYVALNPADPVGAPMELMTRVGKRAAGRELDGRTWDEMPV